MKKRILGLLDSDEKYAERLCHYLTDSVRFGFEVSVFTSKEAFENYKGKDKIDILLTSEEICQKDFNGKIIKLCENREEEGIFKYTSANIIADELMKPFIEEEDGGIKEDSKTVFVGVFSPVGRSMKTSFCVVLGQILARKYRVLYLNFESFSGMSIDSSLENRADLSDLMYYFKNLRKDFRRKFRESILEINGLEYISPAYYFIDLSYVTPEEWLDFLKAIKDMGEYDYVILDLSEYLQGIFDVFLRKCEIVYTMTAGDMRAKNKIFHYEEMLRTYDYVDLLEKTHRLRIPIIRNLPDDWDRVMYSEFSDYIKRELKGDFIF